MGLTHASLLTDPPVATGCFCFSPSYPHV